jgi:hypothetical protein
MRIIVMSTASVVVPENNYDTAALAPQTIMGLFRVLDIEPVTDAVLDAHKEREIDAHPPSFWYKHQSLYSLAGAYSFITMCVAFTLIVVGLLADSVEGVIYSALLGAVSGAGVIYFSSNRTRGPAEWIESPHPTVYTFPADMPYPLRAIAGQLEPVRNQVIFVVGRLRQNDVFLDPYLLAGKVNRFTDEMEWVCVGIWDGDRIIAVAG